jgi:hypothetical protein
MPSSPMDYQLLATVMLIITGLSMDCQPLATITLVVTWMCRRYLLWQGLSHICNLELYYVIYDILLVVFLLHADINNTCILLCSVHSNNCSICTESTVITSSLQWLLVTNHICIDHINA